MYTFVARYNIHASYFCYCGAGKLLTTKRKKATTNPDYLARLLSPSTSYVCQMIAALPSFCSLHSSSVALANRDL